MSEVPQSEEKEPKSYARRNHLLKIEADVQNMWEKLHAFDVSADDADGKKEKFFVTFPYPYMNGVLHLGHAFTLSKAEFAARYQRLRGKKVLFPFGFHCTGMPIAACAQKLQREIELYGLPPTFPPEEEAKEVEESKEAEVTAAAAAPTAPSKKAAKADTKAEQEEDDESDSDFDDEDEEEAKDVPADSKGEKKRKKKAKDAKKKGKSKWQWDIMKEMNVPDEEIPKFTDPLYWLKYFPPIAKEHLREFGLYSDFRRSFITTDVNPYYDAFIRWQFNTLRKKDTIAFGPRNAIFSPMDDQPCADHDRAQGEGVVPMEYTLIKLRLLDVPPVLQAMVPEGKTVYLPAATLRPETMYGQTNCFLLPDGDYGVYEINEREVFVCSDRSAQNMAYQNLSPERGKVHKLGAVKGQDLMGCAVKAPLAKYDKVYVLPLLTIKMNKGTGVVTSVPSDAPDDWAALTELKNKPGLREKYNIKEEHVLPFEVVPIIEVPGVSKQIAADLCTEKKVKTQNDSLLPAIKEQAYNAGFYKGIMTVGEHAGTKVQDAKPLIRQSLIASGDAAPYAEPDGLVVSRSGNECVVAFTDQWFLKYGHDEWKAPVQKHVEGTLETFNPAAKRQFVETVEKLHEWACSRRFGLGTRLPWDKEWVIESLSDSTIYMAYYTVAHLLQGGNLDGSKVGPAGIAPEQLTDEVWNYIFLGAAYPTECGVPEATLAQLRREFEFWYPLDLRVSGKDLIFNHLTMSIYNHAAIWDGQPETRWPRAFFTNGHLMINKMKMSKSEGNFLTLEESIKKYSADATRVVLADAGDGLEDSNFEKKAANKVIIRLTKEEAWIEAQLAAIAAGSLRTGGPESYSFFDRVFANEIDACIRAAQKAYDAMTFREAVKAALYQMSDIRDQYRAALNIPLHAALIERWIHVYVLITSPITPHFCQHLWSNKLKKPGLVEAAGWPTPEPEDTLVARQATFLRAVAADFRSSLRQAKARPAKAAKKGAAAAPQPEINAGTLFVAQEYPEWQRVVIETLSKLYDSKPGDDIKMKNIEVREVSSVLKLLPQFSVPGAAGKLMMGKAMEFSSTLRAEVKAKGAQALDLSSPFDEAKFLTEHFEYVTRDVGLVKADVQAVRPDAIDKAVVGKGANIAERTSPGKPLPYFYHADA